MPLEKEIESVVEAPHSFDAEHIWGGEEWEYKNWEDAHRDMDEKKYIDRQMEEMVGIKTREAFISEKHRNPENDDELAMFFVEMGGARWFKRRFFQYRSDCSEKQISDYYKNREWETKEKNDHV